MTDDLSEQRRKKSRGRTNREFFDLAINEFSDAEAIVIVGLKPINDINTIYTTDNSLIALRLTDIAREQITTDMED